MVYFDFNTLEVFKKHEGRYYRVGMTLGQLIVKAGKKKPEPANGAAKR